MKKMMEKGSYIATNRFMTNDELLFRLNLQLFAEDEGKNEGVTNVEAENNQGNEAAAPETANEPVVQEPQDRMFSRSEVTTVVRKRTERAIRNILKEFGLENKEQIKEYLNGVNQSAKDLEDSHTKYSELEGKYGDLDNKYKSLNREYLYLKNNIVPDKYGDLDKEFQDGLTEEKLLEVLKNHPEFVKPRVVIPEKVGVEGNTKPTATERERAEKLLHVKLD